MGLWAKFNVLTLSALFPNCFTCPGGKAGSLNPLPLDIAVNCH